MALIKEIDKHKLSYFSRNSDFVYTTTSLNSDLSSAIFSLDDT
jgi:hypothetical protein